MSIVPITTCHALIDQPLATCNHSIYSSDSAILSNSNV